MHLPIGVSDFKTLIEYKNPISKSGYLYVDKTLLIKEIIEDGTQVILINRPRRFGKTLSLSMLQYFYASEVDGQATKKIFAGLEITKYADCMQYQGKYPVIFISFKDVKQPTFELTINKIKSVISDVYQKFYKEVTSKKLLSHTKKYVDLVLTENIDRIDLENSLKRLLSIVGQYYNKKPILLIDEYDTPIQEAYLKGYYDELLPFFRNFLSGPLKDEAFLTRGILTGILRISKESLFSGLSNVKINSVLSSKYSNYFGFTEAEVNNLLNKAKLPVDTKETKEWYNGYNFGGITMYNPWSIIEFIAENGQVGPYWVNTSANELIRQLIIKAEPVVKDKISTLIAGNNITEIIDEHIVFGDLNTNLSSLWNLFLMSGYLKASLIRKTIDGNECDLSIPNKEVEFLYRRIIREWLSGARGLEWYREFLSNLANGEVAQFEEKLQTLLDEVLSYHDVTKKSQEAFYHGLMLAFVSGLKETHEIKSNKESGDGRYDVAIIPKDLANLGIVMEFKAVADETKIKETAITAFKQIKKSAYITEFKTRGIQNICLMGIAFSGKKIKIIDQ